MSSVDKEISINYGKLNEDEKKKYAAKNDPTKYYSTEIFNPFGLPTKKDDDKGLIFDPSKGITDQYDSFLNLNASLNENSFENRLGEERHARDMFVMSVTKPLEFLEQKDILLKMVEESVRNIRKSIFRVLVDGKVAPKKAELGSTYCASVMYSVLKDYVNKEIFPSTLEQSIMERRAATAASKLTSPLGAKVDEKIKSGGA